MKKIMGILCALLMLLPVCSGAEQELLMPDRGHLLRLPDSLRREEITAEDSNLWDLYLGDGLELEIFVYQGNGLTLEENAAALTEAGREAELRRIGDTVMLCYRDRDEADGAPCIGYVYVDGERFVELCFWYGTEEAGELTRVIMESFQPAT